jgi:hypothetical protein
LPAREVRRIRAAAGELRFERLYGGWAPSVMIGGARAKALRSADRYVAAIEG